MQRNLPHIISQATNAPLLLEPAYARVFFCALGRESGINCLQIPQSQERLDQAGMGLVTGSYMSGEKPRARFYQVIDGIAVLPVSGTLVHKLGGMRPFSGMTGYDGITARLQQAMDDPEVKGVLLDIDSPGGQGAGAFDCADMIYRLGEQKPVWALANDLSCSAAMLLASACQRRLVTQTSRIGSIGVVMAHTSYAGKLEQEGIDITLIYSGSHKVDLSGTRELPESVRMDYQQRMDDARLMFAEKVSQYTGLSVDAVMETEAAIYDGQAGIDAGLADEMVNAADAVTVMAAALKSKTKGGNMPELTATEAAAQENQRVMGIIGCQEAKGREALSPDSVARQMKLAWDGFINCATEINWQYASARQDAVFSTTAYCPSKALCPNARTEYIGFGDYRTYCKKSGNGCISTRHQVDDIYIGAHTHTTDIGAHNHAIHTGAYAYPHAVSPDTHSHSLHLNSEYSPGAKK